jgi:hypothetical protein
MPTFSVLRRVDAWIDYIAEIEAKTAEDAAIIASDQNDRLSWRRVGEEEFWNARYAALDEGGEEISETSATRG